ncbi:hypothetical protein ACLK1T_26055 [Escherichia coli]
MVHPNVLRNVGIDPEVYSVSPSDGDGASDYVALRRHPPAFIFENDLRFLKQFK